MAARRGASLQRLTTTGASVTYAWTVTGPPAAGVRIRARWAADATVFDVSDVGFTILPSITVTAPNTSVTWGAGLHANGDVDPRRRHGATRGHRPESRRGSDLGVSGCRCAKSQSNDRKLDGTASRCRQRSGAGARRVPRRRRPSADVSNVAFTLGPACARVDRADLGTSHGESARPGSSAGRTTLSTRSVSTSM